MPKRKKIKKIKTTRQFVLNAAKLALDKKAFNLALLDVRPWHALMDYILIVSAQSTKHAQTISEHLKETFKKENIYSLSIEGVKEGKWILMDYNDVIVHIFFDYVRDIFDLEALWHEARRITIPKSYYTSHA